MVFKSLSYNKPNSSASDNLTNSKRWGVCAETGAEPEEQRETQLMRSSEQRQKSEMSLCSKASVSLWDLILSTASLCNNYVMNLIGTGSGYTESELTRIQLRS
ncbi:hypothetical protein AMECASPLE_033080 [Ameca splendens]|uniref:Uncharacterized protein n=1 Tax=Ameca splendens TaxID=208324 RepID=A0ABV0Y7A7_9TELE